MNLLQPAVLNFVYPSGVAVFYIWNGPDHFCAPTAPWEQIIDVDWHQIKQYSPMTHYNPGPNVTPVGPSILAGSIILGGCYTL